MTWYVIFFLSGISSLILAIVDYSREKKITKRGAYLYLSLTSIICLTVNLIYSPIDYYENNKKLDFIDLKNKKLEEAISLQDTNIENLKIENQLLSKNNVLLKEQFKKYKSKIGDLRINFNVSFYLYHPVPINSPMHAQSVALIAFLNKKRQSFSFYQRPSTYYYLTEKEFFPNSSAHGLPYTQYFYFGNAELYGEYPSGQKLDELKNFDIVSIYIPMSPSIDPLLRNNIRLSITHCDLSFTLNSISLEKRIQCPRNSIIEIGSYLERKHNDKFITIQFTLDKNFYDYMELAKF